MKRLVDILFSTTALLLLLMPCILIMMAIRATSAGPAIYWSKRIGQNGQVFRMPKLRTMRNRAPQVATDSTIEFEHWITPLGNILRRTSIDEVPQFWSILVGDMTLVGPRPALFNQIDLIQKRKLAGIDRLKPGLTGWAQVNGRDSLSIDDKVRLDLEYLERRSVIFDLKIVAMTVRKVIMRVDVSH